jgi:hypothetical protein
MKYDNELIDLVISRIVGVLAYKYSKKYNIPLVSALNAVYNSSLYKKLKNKELMYYSENINLLFDEIAK